MTFKVLVRNEEFDEIELSGRISDAIARISSYELGTSAD